MSKEKVNLGYVGVTDFAAYKFSSMYTHRHIFWSYRHEDILFVFVLRYAHSNPFLILVNLYEVSPIHFVTMMDHHWGGSWGGGERIYIYIMSYMIVRHVYIYHTYMCCLFTVIWRKSTDSYLNLMQGYHNSYNSMNNLELGTTVHLYSSIPQSVAEKHYNLDARHLELGTLFRSSMAPGAMQLRIHHHLTGLRLKI